MSSCVQSYLHIQHRKSYMEGLLLRLDRRMSESSTSRAFFLLPQQFPTISLKRIVFMTRNVWVVLIASATVGLSFTVPICLTHPKNVSSGSWLSLPLINAVTPGKRKIRGTSSRKDDTVWEHCFIMYMYMYMHVYIPTVVHNTYLWFWCHLVSLGWLASSSSHWAYILPFCWHCFPMLVSTARIPFSGTTK